MGSYSIEIYSSPKSTCADKDVSSRVVHSGIYPNRKLKPQFSWNVSTKSTAACDSWFHVVPTNFFDMLGSYKVSIIDKTTAKPIVIGQITYWKVSMFPNNNNLQYSLPFNLDGSKNLLVQITGENETGSTILNNLNCSFPSDCGA